MTYLARIIGPAGRETYLHRGREVERDHATHYAHPSAARHAAEVYRQRVAGMPLMVDVIDTRDEERTV